HRGRARTVEQGSLAHPRRGRRDQRLQKAPARLVRRQQGFDPTPQPFITTAGRLQKGSALGRIGPLGCLAEDRLLAHRRTPPPPGSASRPAFNAPSDRRRPHESPKFSAASSGLATSIPFFRQARPPPTLPAAATPERRPSNDRPSPARSPGPGPLRR